MAGVSTSESCPDMTDDERIEKNNRQIAMLKMENIKIKNMTDNEYIAMLRTETKKNNTLKKKFS
jgi:hypothetical protein